MPGKLQVAWGDTALDPDPTWVDVEISGWDLSVGRQYELDRTQTGTATATVKDRAGLYDFLNTGSPLTGSLVPLRRARILEHDPVADSDQVQFTGFIENFHHVLEKKMNLDTVTFELVDIFDVISNREVVPSSIVSSASGSTAGAAGYATYRRDHVDDRLRAAAADAGIPSGFCQFFSGNVDCKGTRYPSGTDLLTVMQEAADAEFPGVANLFVPRNGKATFHGRYARFDYTDETYAIRVWQVGDRSYAVPDGTWAVPSELEWDVDKTKIINACLASPDGIKDWQLFDQLVADSPSIDEYGSRAKTFEGLLTASGDPVGGSGLFTAREETKKFGSYYVANYKDPKPRIERLVFSTPADPLNAANALQWQLLLQVEISDLLNIWTTDPGGGGFGGDGFFVEGVRKTAAPASDMFADITVELDVSAQAYFSDDVFRPT